MKYKLLSSYIENDCIVYVIQFDKSRTIAITPYAKNEIISLLSVAINQKNKQVNVVINKGRNNNKGKKENLDDE